MILYTVMVIIPFILLISASLTDQKAIYANGFSFWPSKFSMAAYEYILSADSGILRAYGVSFFVTVVGTALSLIITALLAYPLSRSIMPHRTFWMFIIVFTMLFHGGMVPSYLVWTQLIHIKNTIWALIIPGFLMNGFNVLLMRTFFRNTIPGELIESAEMDGASEFRILRSIVVPLSTPVLATIGLMQSILYWNDWQNGKIYITKPELFSVQNLLNRIMEDIQFLKTNMPAGSAAAMANLPSESARMAIAVIGVLPILLAYPFFQKYLVKGIMIGAIKG
jgi:putative aldouronate transport system permease protein